MAAADCDHYDKELAKWTVLRYVGVGLIVMYRVFKKMQQNPGGYNFQSFFVASKEFAFSEGIGLLIYFSMAAVTDNIMIFFDVGEDADVYCGYVDMTALYSFAVVSFLPICVVTLTLQGPMYDEDTATTCQKCGFIMIVIVITIVSFLLRLYFVYVVGWAALIDSWLSKVSCKVLVAVAVPPIVDAVQSGVLIFCSNLAGRGLHHHRQQTSDLPTSEAGFITHENTEANSLIDSDADWSGGEEDRGSECCPCREPAQRRRILAEGHLALEASRKGGPKPQKVHGGYVTAKYWGMNKSQIAELWEESKSDPNFSPNDNVYTFVEKFVKPRTANTGMGYALLTNQHAPLEANLMVSHAWMETCVEFFEDLLREMKEHEVAYICFLANYQGSPHEIEDQLGNDIYESPFSQVITNPSCHRMVVIPNEMLKQDGSGLYSRLWCDWEIKAAADAGIPIHIPKHKSDPEYLAGNPGKSSKMARCGGPNDERRIRNAITTMPPQTRKVHAAHVSLFGICCAYASMLVCSLTSRWWMWICGIFIGILLGGIAQLILSTYFRHHMETLDSHTERPLEGLSTTQKEDLPYAVLDDIIHKAGEQRYRYRRLRPAHDVPSICGYCLAFALLDCAIRISVDYGQYHPIFNGTANPVLKYHLFMHCIEGCGIGFLVWPVVNINSMGPWTGVFINSKKGGILWRLFLVVCAIIGSIIGYFMMDKGTGPGAAIGFCVGLFFLSMANLEWNCAIVLFLMIFWMTFANMLHSVAWREVFIMCLSISGIVHAYDWHLYEWKRKTLCLLLIISVMFAQLMIREITARVSDRDWCLCEPYEPVVFGRLTTTWQPVLGMFTTAPVLPVTSWALSGVMSMSTTPAA